MGIDYQWANVEEQQGNLEWVGCREDRRGKLEVLNCSSMIL